MVSVDEVKGRVVVRGLDLLDGTPVLDIKPYVRTYDSFPTAAAGWIDDLPDAPNGPDRLAYWPPPLTLALALPLALPLAPTLTLTSALDLTLALALALALALPLTGTGRRRRT